MRTFNFHFPTPQGPASQPEQCFLLGVEFQEAAVRAGIEVDDPNGGRVAPICPMIVCYAFAAELYLKSLVVTPRRSHLLNVLYQHIENSVRADIAARYKVHTGREPDALLADLRRLGDAFKDWRYVFEGEGQQIHLNLLMAFVKSVYEVARNLHPSWKVRPIQHGRFIAKDETRSIAYANLGGGTFIHLVDSTDGALNSSIA